MIGDSMTSAPGAIISRREASVEMVTHFCESGSSVPSRIPGCSRIWRRTYSVRIV
jgi:hypothetical protein